MMHDASSGLGLTAGIAMGQAGVCVNVQRGNAHVREGPAVESSEDGSPDGPITCVMKWIAPCVVCVLCVFSTREVCVCVWCCPPAAPVVCV